MRIQGSWLESHFRFLRLRFTVRFRFLEFRIQGLGVSGSGLRGVWFRFQGLMVLGAYGCRGSWCRTLLGLAKGLFTAPRRGVSTQKGGWQRPWARGLGTKPLYKTSSQAAFWGFNALPLNILYRRARSPLKLIWEYSRLLFHEEAFVLREVVGSVHGREALHHRTVLHELGTKPLYKTSSQAAFRGVNLKILNRVGSVRDRTVPRKGVCTLRGGRRRPWVRGLGPSDRSLRSWFGTPVRHTAHVCLFC